MKIIIVGAGLAGLSAAISLARCGKHEVIVLEGAKKITEVGAGIQILPNATKILIEYGLKEELEKYVTLPEMLYMNGWKGNRLTSFNYYKQEKVMGGPFWDFHRSDLQKVMLKEVERLGVEVRVDFRVVDLQYDLQEMQVTAVSSKDEKYTGDLLIGADGVYSKVRDLMVGHPDPPTPTGDLAYRVMLKAEKVMSVPELRYLIETPQVNYWLGPNCHSVNYVLKKGSEDSEYFNFVLLCPDNLPDNLNIGSGSIDELKSIYQDWDPILVKLIDLIDGDQIDKWKLNFRSGIEHWYDHKTGLVCLLGDSVHATLPYLSAGAGMAIEDGAVLGKLLSTCNDKSQLIKNLAIYEQKRKQRTEKIVERGNHQQHLYHLHDGEEQKKRDEAVGSSDPPPGEVCVWRDKEFAPWLLGYELDV